VSGAGPGSRPELRYSDGIAASRIIVALRAPSDALQSRLPDGWEVAPYAGDDPRGRSLRDANLVLSFHEVTATHDPVAGSDHRALRYVAFLVPARHTASGTTAHMHFHLVTNDPAGAPGKYLDAHLGRVARRHERSEDGGSREVRDRFAVEGDDGGLELSITHTPGGLTQWVTAARPDFPVRSAVDPAIERWYQEDVAFDVVRSRPLGLDRLGAFSLEVTSRALADVFDGSEEAVGVVMQPTYIRRVFVPVSAAT
jgi:hypothetical protein